MFVVHAESAKTANIFIPLKYTRRTWQLISVLCGYKNIILVCGGCVTIVCHAL